MELITKLDNSNQLFVCNSEPEQTSSDIFDYGSGYYYGGAICETEITRNVLLDEDAHEIIIPKKDMSAKYKNWYIGTYEKVSLSYTNVPSKITTKVEVKSYNNL